MGGWAFEFSPEPSDFDIEYAQALIADLLEGLDGMGEEYDDILLGAIGAHHEYLRSRRSVTHQGAEPKEGLEYWLFMAVLAAIRERAGIGEEG